MIWKDTPPAIPGYYWARTRAGSTELVCVLTDFRVTIPGDRTRYRIADFTKWWYGPILAPRFDPK